MTFKLSIKNISLFAFIWLNLGFALGFAVLVGPVRWVANYSRQNNYSDSSENLIVKAVMIAFVAVSFMISTVLVSKISKAKVRNIKIFIPLICLALGGFALYEFLNPENLKNFSGRETEIGEKRFVFGSYPNKEDLARFKKEGISSVISLLHPAVTPFEPLLLKEEEENCKKAGLKLISVPMLPWISENEAALNTIKQLANHPEGKYYVHCYLGKDRVNLVKRLISTYDKSVELEATSGSGRSLESITKFERGDITKIGESTYFTPYPTDEEYLGYIVGGGVREVISLMDSTDKEQMPRIESERKLLETYHIPFKNFSVHSKKDKQELTKLKELISSSPKPLVIHRFFSNTAEDLQIVEALKK